MASNVNIGGDPMDPNYRYKRPVLQVKLEGSGNGKKTRLPNIVQVAKSLKVPPAYPVRYFGYDLGARCDYDAAEEAGIINGYHLQPALETALNNFINLYVLCQKCKLPETDIEVSKSGKAMSNCSACGHYGELDQANKFTQYIIKNPPEKKKKTKKAAAAKAEASTKQAAAAAAPPSGDFEVDIDVSSKQVSDDVEWYTDTSKEAVLARQAEEIAGNELLQAMATRNVEKSVDEASTEFKTWLNASPRTQAEVIAELTRVQERLSYSGSEMIALLCDATWDADLVKGKTLQTLIPYFKKYLAKEPKSQKNLLKNIEMFLCLRHPTLIKFAPAIIKGFYDAELVDKDVILKWAEKPSAKGPVSKELGTQIRAASKQLTDWLAEESEEDEEEGEEDEDMPQVEDDEDDDDEEDDDEEDDDDEDDETPAAKPAAKASAAAAKSPAGKAGAKAAPAPTPAAKASATAAKAAAGAASKKGAAAAPPAKKAAAKPAEDDLDLDDI